MFDFVGVLVLVVLIALFGFLATRAWRAKSGLLRWGGGILTGLLTLIPVLLLVLALIGFGKLNQRHNNPIPNIPVTAGPAQIARGEKLANVCVSCHSSANRLPLSGANFVAQFSFPPIGTLYAPNLTPAGDIQDWSDGEVIRAIRDGVHKDGRSLLIMPSTAFRNLSDDDVAAVVAYLRNQPGVGQPTPRNRLSVLGALFINVADIRTVQQPVGQVVAPKPGVTADYGKYMVGILACSECHGDQLQGKVDTGRPGPPAGPNLRALVPAWTEEQFMALFNSGQLPGGGKVPIETLASGYSQPRMPWPEFRAAASDDELKAIYVYLHGLSPLN